MGNLEELLKVKDEVWFELLKKDFRMFVDFSSKNNLSWKWGGEVKIDDFKNHIDFAHISIDKNGKCCFIPMFMWVKEEYKKFKV